MRPSRQPTTLSSNEELAYREAEQALWRSVGAAPTERRVRLPHYGIEVRVQELGDGPPALFVHGSPNSGSTWAPLAPHLDGIRCLYLDRPGTGLSDPLSIPPGRELTFTDALITDVLDGLEIERADLVVSSLGGYLGLRTAMLHPHRVRRMVQMGCPGPVLDAPTVAFVRMLGIPGVARMLGRLPATRRGGQMQLRQIGHGSSLDAGRISGEFLDWYFALQRHTDTMREELAFMRRVVTTRGFTPQSYLTAEHLAQVETPTRFLWGEADAFGDRALARRVVQTMPAAQLEMQRDAGHLPWLDDPGHAAAIIHDFLRDAAR